MASTDDLWIDLSSLISCSVYENGFKVACYEYLENENKNEMLHYNLRLALRAVGHKITKVETYYNDDYKCVGEWYYTTITEKEGEAMTLRWNEYCDIFEEHS